MFVNGATFKRYLSVSVLTVDYRNSSGFRNSKKNLAK